MNKGGVETSRSHAKRAVWPGRREKRANPGKNTQTGLDWLFQPRFQTLKAPLLRARRRLDCSLARRRTPWIPPV